MVPDIAVIVWAQFALCLALIGVAGTQLSRYGDVIADKTGLGGTWIGVIMLATVTSLPELATGISSVTISGVPDIAIGDALGSCVFNLLIIVVLDFLHRHDSVYRVASQGHVLSGALGIILIGLVGVSLLIGSSGPVWSFGHVGLYTPMILVLYLVSVRAVFRYEVKEVAAFANAEPDRYPELSLRAAAYRYLAAAAVVVGAGIWLPTIGHALAQQMAWHQSFVGTLFVAFVTSVPELVVTVAALRLGAVDMAIGNLFGSNLFNILVIGIDDLLYTAGPILGDVALAHGVSAISAMVMTGIAVAGLIYRPTGRVLRTVGWASLFLVAVYLMNSYVLYLHG